MLPSKMNNYTTDDIYALPEGQRAELINGNIYNMAPPNTMHQRIVMNLSKNISNYIDGHKGSCEVFPAPFAVFLNQDNKTYLEPDISVICDGDKLDEQGCKGAPDWIIEVTSPSDPQRDYGVKLFLYRTAGVREYWIVNPQKETVMVYDFEKESRSNQYNFTDSVPSCIYGSLTINLSQMLDFKKT